MSHLAQGVAPKAPRGDQEAERAAGSQSETQSSGAAEPDDYLAPWEQPEEPAPARVAPEPAEQPAAPQEAAKRPAAPNKKSPRKEPKYPPGVMKAMTDAVMEGAYPEGGVPASKARLAGVKAAELLDAGYAPEDIPEIVEFLKRDPFWRNKITPGVLVSEAPRWKSATAKRRAASAQRAAGEKEEEITPELQAELDRLNAHFANDPFGVKS